MNNSFEIMGSEVGNYLSPYVIAEIGVNHECSVETAKKQIELAAKGGAHAAKFQVYKAERIASRSSPAYWDMSEEPTNSQYKLFKKYDAFGELEYEELAKHCRLNGIHFLSTPFDTDAVKFLEPLVPAFKIASADLTNVPLIRECASTKKPLLISVGAATLCEIEFATEIAREAGARNICLLHCVLNYPTKPEEAQLNRINILKRIFPDCLIGYSDHVKPDESLSALEVAALFGAAVIEKHFTHDKSLPGNDHYHAMDHDDLLKFSEKLNKYRMLVKDQQNRIEIEESARRHARRSIVTACAINKGEVFTEKNLTAKRPAYGISPVHWDDVIGRTAARNLEEDRVLSWDGVSEQAGLTEND